MKKIITAMVLVTLMASMTPVLAIPTQANAQSGGSIPPVVMAKAEWIMDGAIDDNSDKPWLQVNPSGVYGQSRTLGYLVVATDLDGYDDLSAAYADVYHPDGSFKYQVAMPLVISCTDNNQSLDAWINYLTNKYNHDLITFAEPYNLTGVIAKLRQCSAKLFVGEAELDYCQMCGEFEWENTCEECQSGWEVTDFCTGYRVDAYAYDKTGAESAILTNYFEYVCEAGLETDFEALDFESVRYQVHKWIEGDRVFDNSKGPACLPVADGGSNSACVAPTYRNIGNMPLTGVSILQDDMQFNYSGPSTNKDWNVQWDARIGDYNDNPTVVFNPFEETTVVGAVDLCALDKISFSIYVKKMATTGEHTGTVTLTPIPAQFPWFQEVDCDQGEQPTG